MGYGKSYHPVDNMKMQQPKDYGAAQQVNPSYNLGAPTSTQQDPQEAAKWRRERMLEMVIRNAGATTDVIGLARAAVDFIEKG